MSISEFLGRLAGALERASVPYMLAGSFASSYHGEPRTTQDVDLVIDTDRAGIGRLIAELPADDYYVDQDTAFDALRRGSQFNVIDMNTGWKADLIIRKRRAFSEAEFARRQQATLAGVSLWVASPEDVILSKLEWAKRAASERQLRDVQGILRAKGEELDLAYIQRWVTDLSLDEQWQRVRPGDAGHGDSSGA